MYIYLYTLIVRRAGERLDELSAAAAGEGAVGNAGVKRPVFLNPFSSNAGLLAISGISLNISNYDQ